MEREGFAFRMLYEMRKRSEIEEEKEEEREGGQSAGLLSYAAVRASLEPGPLRHHLGPKQHLATSVAH